VQSGGLASNQPTAAAATIGLYNPAAAVAYLRNSNDTGYANTSFGYGPAGAGWMAIAGDWDGDGTDTLGLYNPATSKFYLRNSNTTGAASVTFAYGPAGGGWIPIAGDWDGDGKDTVGLYNPRTSKFYLRNTNSTGNANVTFAYGPADAGWTPLAGDWNGDGTATVGLYNPATSTFYLRNTNTTGNANVTFAYGAAGAGWKPLVGDWNGDGRDTIGLRNPATSTFYLRDSNTTGYANRVFAYGPAGSNWTPIVGDWSGMMALQAAGGPVVAAQNAPVLTQADLQPIIREAIARWSSAGLNASTLAKLSQVQFVIGDLSGSYLGEADGNHVYLDRNAAGYGWFVDSTPAADDEFAAAHSGRQLQAVDPRAVDRIDLLTVVEHELGHVAGLGDLDPAMDDLMSGVLGVGVRRDVCPDDLVAVLASK
jgi:hypothetical protein